MLLRRSSIFVYFFPGKYGSSLNFWNWTTRTLEKTLDLGPEGLVPLEVRFLHNPLAPEGFVGCSLGGSIFRIFKSEVGFDLLPVTEQTGIL